jgi:hypothetical protein
MEQYLIQAHANAIPLLSGMLNLRNVNYALAISHHNNKMTILLASAKMILTLYGIMPFINANVKLIVL